MTRKQVCRYCGTRLGEHRLANGRVVKHCVCCGTDFPIIVDSEYTDAAQHNHVLKSRRNHDAN